MKKLKIILLPIFFIWMVCVVGAQEDTLLEEPYCLTGAFIADRPSEKAIIDFGRGYGKKPYFVLLFVDWQNHIDADVFLDIEHSGCRPLVTWEPWHAEKKEGIDYDGLLRGRYDQYIELFARRMKSLGGVVYLRFAHEMNGSWYPWSVSKISPGKYKALYRYVKNLFDKIGVDNVRWIFSLNWEDAPETKTVSFMSYYPGGEYVDFIGIDGYNWGDTQPWSRWQSFEEIFKRRYEAVTAAAQKPIIISEFGCADSGGNKTLWIRKAMQDIKSWHHVKGFVLFNVDKECRWSFSITRPWGRELKNQLQNLYFKESLV